MNIKRKVVKEMRFDELLRYVWDNDVKEKSFTSNEHAEIYVDSDGWVSIDNRGYVSPDELYKVEVDEEITEHTRFDVAVVFDEHLGDRNKITRLFRTNINDLKEIEPGGYIKFIYLQNSDGSIGELIWKDGKMVGGSEG